MGITPAIASLVGGGLSAGSSLFGSQEQAGAAEAAQQTELQMFNQMAQYLQPYIKSGQTALPQLQNLLGLGKTGGAGMESTLANMPGYNFTLDQGLKSVQNQLTARGLGGSGAAEKGAASYATGLAQSQYGNYVNQLLGLGQLGAQSGEALGGAGVQAGQYIGNAGVGGANALAAGGVGAANSLSNNALLYSMLSGQSQSGGWGGYGDLAQGGQITF